MQEEFRYCFECIRCGNTQYLSEDTVPFEADGNVPDEVELLCDTCEAAGYIPKSIPQRHFYRGLERPHRRGIRAPKYL